MSGQPFTAEVQRTQRKRREHLREAEEVVRPGSDVAKKPAHETQAGGGL